ncbi:hypothetical protein E5347_13910 [Clostridium sartagoforme]|uniref:Uncharacterized protein n=1 Tax=Clostridium sartagoforme TaxID=84031 RepID=A0A4S2DFZ5_9CLOT|nr:MULTISPECIES: hypothetical protein [Clostridium]MBS5938722.1 hypothetical protein [Clostridium sp.]TGY40947.1 hypothetical protein E5347_13910 [Clostridium sartagoforme]
MDFIIYGLVVDYLNGKVTSDIKDEFINASVHFNVNNDIYNKYSSVEIEYMLSKIEDENIIDYVELCSVYGYILYRTIENGNLKDDDRIEALQIVLEISNSISGFLRASLNEKELYEKLIKVTKKLKLTEKQNKEILDLLN